MDNMAYLREISGSPKARKASLMKAFSPKMVFWVLVPVFVVALVMMVVVAISNINASTAEAKLVMMNRVAMLTKSIEDNEKEIKDPNLRAKVGSLKSVLLVMKNELDGKIAVAPKKDKKGKTIDGLSAKRKKQEEELSKNLEQNLYNAKLNGLTDRWVQKEYSYHASLMASLISETAVRSKKPEVKKVLLETMKSIQAIQKDLADFVVKY